MLGWHLIDTIILIIYLIIALGIGIYSSKRKTETVEDYAIAGKSVSTFAIVATLIATNMGGGSAMGRSGLAWFEGAKSLTPFLGGWLVGIPLLILITDKIRATNCVSVADLMNKRYGKKARLVSSILVAINALLIVALGYLSFGTIFAYVGESIGITKEVGSLVACIITIIYTSVGGYYAVVMTDVFQFVVFMISIVLIAPMFLMNSVGGFGKILEFGQLNNISILNPFQGLSIELIGLMLLWAIVWLTDPMVYQRVISAESDKAIKKSLLYYIPTELIFGLSLVILSISGRMLMPNLVEQYGTSEAVLPAIIVNYLPPVVAGLSFASILSILMSTIDSCLLVVGHTVMEDIIMPYKEKKGDPIDDKKAIKNLKWLTFTIGIVALIVSYKMSSIWFAMVFALSAYAPSILWPLVFSVTWEKATEVASIITMLVTFAFVSIINIFNINIFGLAPDSASLIVGIPLSLILMVGLSLFTYKEDVENIDTI